MTNIYKIDVNEVTHAATAGLKNFCNDNNMKYDNGKLSDRVDPAADVSYHIEVEFFDGVRDAFWNYYK